jgi:uncharacterized protein YjiS (DUF1127 family)
MSDLMMTRFTSARRSAGRAVLEHPIETLRIALRTYLTRQALPDLSARELDDLGISSGNAITEAARLPWDTAPGPRAGVPAGVFGGIQAALERARTRRLIGRLQTREPRDIGVSPSDAQTEAGKPFWRP